MKSKRKSIVRLTDDEINFIREHASEWSCVKIAAWIGCVPSTVTYHIHKLGLAKSTITWTEERIRTLILYSNNGFCVPQIAIFMGTNANNLWNRIKLLKKKGIIAGRTGKLRFKGYGNMEVKRH